MNEDKEEAIDREYILYFADRLLEDENSKIMENCGYSYAYGCDNYLLYNKNTEFAVILVLAKNPFLLLVKINYKKLQPEYVEIERVFLLQDELRSLKERMFESKSEEINSVRKKFNLEIKKLKGE